MSIREKTYWRSDEGLTLILGWRRSGESVEAVMRRLEISGRTLKQWRTESAELDAAFGMGKEIADFRVETAVFEKAVGGDLKACELWLKLRMPDRWGKGLDTKGDAAEVNRGYLKLAELINNPVERERK